MVKRRRWREFKSSLKIAIILSALLTPAIPQIYHSADATVTDTDVKTVSSLGNGVTTNFTIGFDFRDNDDIEVYLQDESASPYTRTQVVYGSGAGKYTITGGDPGTTVVMGTAPSSTQRVVIKRVLTFTQGVDYVESAAFPASDHEEAMDKMTMLLQQLNADVSSKIGLSDVSTATTPTFPEPVASSVIAWNSSADDLETVTIASIVPTLSGANKILGADAAGTGKEWKTLSGTSNQVTVTHGVGSVTLAVPQDIGTVSSPTFAGMTLSGLTATTVPYVNGSKAFASSTVTPTELGYLSGVNASLCGATQSCTMTNKTISGSSNTLSNIGNSSLTNSSVTVGSTSISLGSTAATISGLTLASATSTGTFTAPVINSGSAVPLDLKSNGTTAIYVDTSQNVGFGTTSPASVVDVNGSVRVAMDSASCVAGKVGSIRYNSGTLEYCSGSGWQALGLAGSGLQSLGSLTATTQTFATGTSGTDFAISSSSSTHTFNIPDASASARGLVTTGTQTIGGEKSFNGRLSLIAPGTVSVPSSGNAQLSSDATNGFQTIGNGSTYDFTFLNASGSNVISNPHGTTNTYFGGSIGVGTASPGSYGKIAVHGAPVSRGGANIMGFFYNSSSSGAHLMLQDTGSSEGATIGVSTNDLLLSTGSGGTVTERLRIKSDGRVGIGESNPGRLLDVKGNATYDAIINLNRNSTSTASSIKLQTAGTDSWSVGTGILGSGPGETFHVYNFNNSSTALTIDSSSNVGIGKTPSAKLDVNGEIDITSSVTGLDIIHSTASNLSISNGGGTSTLTLPSGSYGFGLLQCCSVSTGGGCGIYQLAGSYGGASLVTTVGGTWTAVAGTAGNFNVTSTGSVITIENKTSLNPAFIRCSLHSL